jgi:hypothetical protein
MRGLQYVDLRQLKEKKNQNKVAYFVLLTELYLTSYNLLSSYSYS